MWPGASAGSNFWAWETFGCTAATVIVPVGTVRACGPPHAKTTASKPAGRRIGAGRRTRTTAAQAQPINAARNETPYTPVYLATWMMGANRYWVTPREAQGNPVTPTERRYSSAVHAAAAICAGSRGGRFAGHGPGVARSSGGFGKGDRAAGTHRQGHPHA